MTAYTASYDLYDASGTKVHNAGDAVAKTEPSFATWLAASLLNPVADKDNTGPVSNPDPRIPSAPLVSYTSEGAQTVRALGVRYYAEKARTITSVRASLGTAPVGSTFIVDVQLNGTSIFATSTTHRPTIADGGHTAIAGSADTVNVKPGDYLTVSVLQVGSGTAGSDLTVQVHGA